MRRNNSWLVLALGLLLVPFLRAQTPQDSARKPFGWKIASPTATVYLVGSIHVAKPDLYPLHPAIEDAFSKAAVLGVEIDATNPAAAQALMSKALYPGAETIDSHIAREVVIQADDRLRRLGLSMAQLSKFKPWFIAETISIMELKRLGYTPENGIDVYFLQRAKGAKKIVELETADQQVGIFDGMNDKEQELFLLYTIKEVDDTREHAKEIFEAWQQGDAPRLEKFLTETSAKSPELLGIWQRLIDDRNKTMAAKIDEYLRSNDTHFIVVGSAHLVGEKGILNLLTKAGYKVEPL
jgi:uncharacterized protein YbaP (TraB family)